MITVAVANHGGAESQNSDVNGGRSVNGKRLAMVAVTALVILVTVGLLLSSFGGAPNKAATFLESTGNLPAGLSSLHSESSRTVLLKPAVSTTYAMHFVKTRWPIAAAVSVALLALAVLAIVMPLLSSGPEVSETIENQPTDEFQVDNDLVDEEEPEFFGIQANLGYLVAGALAFIILVVVVWAVVGRVGGNQDEDQPQKERLNTPNKQNQISKQQQQQQEPEEEPDEQEEEEQENLELEQDGQQRQEMEQQKQAVPDDQRKNKEEQQEAMPRQQEEQRNQEEGEETEQQEEQSQEELNEEQQKLRAARSLRKDEKRLQKQERLGLRPIRLEKQAKDRLLKEQQKKKQEKEKRQQSNRQRKQQQRQLEEEQRQQQQLELNFDV